jgi:hypothetical protein
MSIVCFIAWYHPSLLLTFMSALGNSQTTFYQRIKAVLGLRLQRGASEVGELPDRAGVQGPGGAAGWRRGDRQRGQLELRRHALELLRHGREAASGAPPLHALHAQADVRLPRARSRQRHLAVRAEPHEAKGPRARHVRRLHRGARPGARGGSPHIGLRRELRVRLGRLGTGEDRTRGAGREEAGSDGAATTASAGSAPLAGRGETNQQQQQKESIAQ